MSSDGYVYSKSTWNTSNNSKAVGVAVKTNKCAFVIAPEEHTSIQWGGYNTLISGCTTYTSEADAKLDYKGKENTDAIIAVLGVYKAMLSGMNINDFVESATIEAESLPSTQVETSSIITDEEYKLLIQKIESGETLTSDEVQQTNDYRNSQIRNEFMTVYGIPSNEICYIVCDKIRNQFKELVKSQSEIALLPTNEEDAISNILLSESDIDALSNEGIMVLATTASSDYAANYCRNYTFKNGKAGYLPALGELYEAHQNKAEVDACMSLIGGKAMYMNSENNLYKWSSTQYSAYFAWYLHWDGGYIYYYTKDIINYDLYCARPFSAFL